MKFVVLPRDEESFPLKNIDEKKYYLHNINVDENSLYININVDGNTKDQ